MTSLWLADRIESATAAGTFEDADYDVVVVGAGITGLTRRRSRRPWRVGAAVVDDDRDG